jgi:hypothetical protein
MKWKGRAFVGIGFGTILITALLFRPDYPVLVVVGESSVGTWVSGVLLIFSAAFSLIIALQRSNRFWYFITSFFIVLALDERFMFHEQIKEFILFGHRSQQVSVWVLEMPVLAGAFVGLLVSISLWSFFSKQSRIYLAAAVVSGTISVSMDVLATGALWEELLKLSAELLITFALMNEIRLFREVEK